MENSIEKRTTSNIYEDGERKFKLGSYDPIEGNYILVQIMTFALPFGIGDAIAGLDEGTEKREAPKSLPKMGKEEFKSLMRDILMTVSEVYEGGNSSPVVRDNGTYGVADLTMALAVKLVIASLAFNFKSFFEDVPLLKEHLHL